MAYDEASERDIVAELNDKLRDATPQDVLRTAIETYGAKLAMVSSFGAESAVLLHMAAQIDKSVAILFLDTGMLFGQTLDYRKNLAADLGLTGVRDLRPAYADLATQDPSANLWKTDTDACCNIRKVLPLDRALEGYEAWITGRKRFHGGDRMRLPIVERSSDGKIKFNPLATMTKEALDAYAKEHDLPAHPLVSQGFPSIGCWPCTQPVEEGQDVRAGRWAGQDKSECGIHVERASPESLEVGGDI